MWPSLYDYFGMLPYGSQKIIRDFYIDPHAKSKKSRIGAHQKPKAKMTKHRKAIKKMKI